MDILLSTFKSELPSELQHQAMNVLGVCGALDPVRRPLTSLLDNDDDDSSSSSDDEGMYCCLPSTVCPQLMDNDDDDSSSSSDDEGDDYSSGGGGGQAMLAAAAALSAAARKRNDDSGSDADSPRTAGVMGVTSSPRGGRLTDRAVNKKVCTAVRPQLFALN